VYFAYFCVFPYLSAPAEFLFFHVHRRPQRFHTGEFLSRPPAVGRERNSPVWRGAHTRKATPLAISQLILAKSLRYFQGKEGMRWGRGRIGFFKQSFRRRRSRSPRYQCYETGWRGLHMKGSRKPGHIARHRLIRRTPVNTERRRLILLVCECVCVRARARETRAYLCMLVCVLVCVIVRVFVCLCEAISTHAIHIDRHIPNTLEELLAIPC
jgi:hypothetical protein